MRASISQLIPTDVATWQQFVISEQIANRTLAEIADDKAFSGSKIPFKSFLQLRAIWPKKLNPGKASKTLQAAGFFTSDDVALASKLVFRSGMGCRRGLDKLDAFLKYLDREETPTRPETPPRFSKCSGEDFGAFAAPLQNLGLLLPERKGVPDSEIYTPRIYADREFRWLLEKEGEAEGEGGLDKILKLDLNKSDVAHMTPLPDDNLEGIMNYLDIVNEESPDTPDSPLAQARYRKMSQALRAGSARASYKGTAGDDAGTTNEAVKVDIREAIGGEKANPAAQQRLDSPTNPNLTTYSLQPQSRPSRFPPGRTRYEVQTSTFFFSFLSALQAHVFPIFPVPPIIAIPEECRYGFGWLPSALPTTATSTTTTVKMTTTTNKPLEQVQHKCQRLYIACPDGAFLRQESLSVRLRFAYFELKPFRREGAKFGLIAMEETAEIAAILYEELWISKDEFVVPLFFDLS